MPYPIVSEAVGKAWYREWQEACEHAGFRVAPPQSPIPAECDLGGDVDWVDVANSMVQKLDALHKGKSEGYLESEGAVIVHEALPDHEALCDPEFWYWLATGPGAKLIGERYPFKLPNSSEPISPHSSKKFLPGRNNFVGSSARETLFFRFWIRAEMAMLLDEDSKSKFEYVRPGLIDFWRSHVFRQLYAHHRPFVQAFIDFQFPAPSRENPRLETYRIRQLARDLSKSCANVTVELLDRDQCGALIERQWLKTEARLRENEEGRKELAAE